MKQMKNKVNVVKIGGSTLGKHDTTLQDIVELQKRGYPLVVVHGGGKVITEWLARSGASSRFVQGERVTDKLALEVVTAVLAGLVNKELVSAINSLGGRAIGLSGADGSLVQGKIKNTELGYVGNIVKVDTAPLETLLKAGYVPVVAPVSLNAFDKPEDVPALLNMNADAVAGEVAAAMGAEKLIFLTDVVGICDQSGKLLAELSAAEAENLIASGVASGGMIPKIKAGIRALSRNSTVRIIDGREPHALRAVLEGQFPGTTIHA